MAALQVRLGALSAATAADAFSVGEHGLLLADLSPARPHGRSAWRCCRAIVFQTGQARWADTGTVLFGPVRKRPGPAATVPLPSTARPRARAWATMPARWHGPLQRPARGRHGLSRWMEPLAC